jgi:hypothetical protein
LQEKSDIESHDEGWRRVEEGALKLRLRLEKRREKYCIALKILILRCGGNKIYMYRL